MPPWCGGDFALQVLYSVRFQGGLESFLWGGGGDNMKCLARFLLSQVGEAILKVLYRFRAVMLDFG